MNMLSNHAGKTSAMRVGFIACLFIGAVVSIAGIIAMFYSVPAAGTAITTGTALMGGSGFSKAVQSRYEHDNK